MAQMRVPSCVFQDATRSCEIQIFQIDDGRRDFHHRVQDEQTSGQKSMQRMDPMPAYPFRHKKAITAE
jgi:hypothetical protein